MKIQEIFSNKVVLITGHTGFKGSWLTAWLQHLNAEVHGISHEIPTNPSHFEVAELGREIKDWRFDLRDPDKIRQLVEDIQPDYIFHLAAQALVRLSYEEPLKTYQTNVLGTLHLLEALRTLKKPCVAVMITSDKCYDNVEWVWGYRENDRLGGPDPYSASKGAAEIAIRSHVKSFLPDDGKVRIGICRAGNVIGGGDWAEDRIIPDCVRSWASGESVLIRNPNSTRPWQHVLEPLRGYMSLAEALHKSSKFHGEPFNFGPPAHQNYSVRELVNGLSKHWPKTRWEDVQNSENDFYESGLLKLNCDKALQLLNWQPVLNFEETTRMTAEWYSTFYRNSSMIREMTFAQICDYESLISN